MKNQTFRPNLLASTFLATMLAFGSTGVAFAQDASADEELKQETVTVTGSRISKPNIVSSSPITSVGKIDFSLANTVNTEQFLNTLPQVVPGFDSSSNNPGTGEATVDLRGLGSNRTLVLVNGRRYVSSNQNAGSVDLNTIPAALVESVDILTGGASAVYGSDAVAGVVNFIMKDDFEGVEISAGVEQSADNDGDIFNAAMTFGGNFADDRGNAVLSLEYTNRGSILQGDRPESFVTLNDSGDTAGLTETGSVNIPSTFGLSFDIDYTDILGIAPDATNATFTTADTAIPDGAVLPTCSVEGTSLLTDTRQVAAPTADDPDATVTESFIVPSSATGDGFCSTDSFGFIFAPDGPGILPFISSGPNNNRYNYAPANYLQIPQERYSMFGSVSYDITDDLEAYAQAVFVSSQVEVLLAPTPVFTSLTINLDNPFLAQDPEALAALTAVSNAQTNPDSNGDGINDAVISTGRRLQETGGRVSSSRNDSFQINTGLRGSFAETWNWDLFGSYGEASSSVSQTGNISLSAYQEAVLNGTANIFDENGLTQDVVDQIAVTGIISGTTRQLILSGTANGELMGYSSPFAENAISVAYGFEYRDENLSTLGAGLGSDVRGFNQAPDISGGFTVAEVFGEINAPLIEDAPFAEEVTFTGAYRVSNYGIEGVGTTNSYAAGLSWTPIDGIRLRGQFQQAVRAPNVGELFSPQTNGFPNIQDPCSGGDNGGFQSSISATLTANCENNPVASANVPSGAAGTNLQVNAQIEGLFGGNPSLQEETAETLTLGAIWEPTFIDNLTVTADYYNIAIEDLISNVPSQTIFDFCYVDGLTQFCNAIRRNADGTVNNFDSFSQNVAEATVEGVDLSVDYSFDTDKFGTFGVYSLIGYVASSELTPLPGEDPIESAGFYGENVGEPTPEWTFNTRFDWQLGDLGARLRWSRISEVKDKLTDSAAFDPTTLLIEGVDAYDQLDLSLFYSLNDNIRVTLGVENLADTDYVIIGDGSAEQSNTYPATYDTIGRTFFGRVTATF